MHFVRQQRFYNTIRTLYRRAVLQTNPLFCVFKSSVKTLLVEKIVYATKTDVWGPCLDRPFNMVKIMPM